MPLIGVLMGFAETDPTAQSWLTEFRGSLAKRGWTEGSNLRIELRWGAGDAERITRLAKELVDLQPASIFGQTTPVIDALARETRRTEECRQAAGLVEADMSSTRNRECAAIQPTIYPEMQIKA